MTHSSLEAEHSKEKSHILSDGRSEIIRWYRQRGKPDTPDGREVPSTASKPAQQCTAPSVTICTVQACPRQ